MPIPPNTTPATATAIIAADLPFVDVLDVSEAPEGSGYPIDDCNGDEVIYQFSAVWYQYTAGECDAVIAVLAERTSGGPSYTVSYQPQLAVWTGTLPDITLDNLTVAGEARHWCASQEGGFWFEIPVIAGQTLFFQVFNQPFDAGGNLIGPPQPIPDSDLRFQVRAAPNMAVPAGSVFIPTDESGFPAVIVDAAAGTLLRLVTFPACEQAAILQDGTMCAGAESGGTGQSSYLVEAYEIVSPGFVGIATVTTAMLGGGSGGSNPPPPGPPPPTPPPPPGGCGAPFVAPGGMDAAVAAALSGAGATVCANVSVLAAAEGALNAAGYAIQRTSPAACGMRYRIHKCPGQLTGTHCGKPMCSAYTGGGGSAQDIDIEANGGWAWVPR